MRRSLALVLIEIVATSCGGNEPSTPAATSTSPAPAQVHVLGANVTPVAGDDAIVTFIAHNAGAETDTLESASCSCARNAAIDGDISLPTETTGTFDPDGPHVVLEGVERTVRPGDFVDVVLIFRNAGEVTATAEVVKR